MQRASQRYATLLSPLQVGALVYRNRIVKTSAKMSFDDGENGYVSACMIRFYEETARGGAATVLVEAPGIDGPQSVLRPSNCHYIDDDKYIPRLRELSKAIHKHGAHAILQLLHAGSWHEGEEEALAASDWKEPEFPGGKVPRAATYQEVQRIKQKFVEAVVRGREAGFHGVEISTSASHFLPTFLNRFWNQRKDEYGTQTLENRARLLCEIIRGARAIVGAGFNIGVMMNVVESMEGGLTYGESLGIAKLYEEAGAAYIHGRAFVYGSATTFWPEQELHPELSPQAAKVMDMRAGGKAAYRAATARLKEVLSIPVITVANIDPATGEDILRKGDADLIGMCRPLIADPQLPNKLASDRAEDIVPCTHCLNCLQRWIIGRPVACRVNAGLGQYDEYVPAELPKNVLIVGAGPAGLEAARVAAMRGHRVTLIEREKVLGGQMLLASAVKGKEPEDLEELVEYYRIQLEKLSVTVKPGTAYSEDLLEREQPDAVLFATGPRTEPLRIPDNGADIVVNSAALLDKLRKAIRVAGANTIHSLSRMWMPLGDRVVIVGGGYQGCQLAEFLVKRGRSVHLVERGQAIGVGIVPHKLMRLLTWFDRNGVGMLTESEVLSISGNIVTVAARGERRCLHADSVIVIGAPVANADFVEQAKGLVEEVYQVGGSREPGMILDAIADGYRVGHAL